MLFDDIPLGKAVDYADFEAPLQSLVTSARPAAGFSSHGSFIDDAVCWRHRTKW